MTSITVSPAIQHMISNDLANHYKVVPKEGDDARISFFIDENEDIECRDELELLLGKEVSLLSVPSEAVEKALSLYYRQDRNTDLSKTFSTDHSEFLENLFYEAKSLKCSDIHFEAFEKNARIRFRIDGQLIERYKIEQDNYLELVNKVKIRAKLNITEKRLPQDGRITTDSFDIRVSILPTLFGEKIVMRLLGQDASNIDLSTLGLKEEELRHYLEAVRKPNGIILISGPTGSGKTTTLYATLRLLNDSKRNIVTVEDPIEYTLGGINQVQLKEDIGLTFAAALRSFLRQDPDIIMLGEIRDPETALMAIRASLTGHLVLSTIHTNSAAGTISRLIDMGIPAYLIAETLNLSAAQRLVRRLCTVCKEEVQTEASDFPIHFQFPYPLAQHFRAKGCNACYHTGYSGRIAIYEILPVDHGVALQIKNNDFAKLGGKEHETLGSKAFRLLAEGVTSLEEIYSILITI